MTKVLPHQGVFARLGVSQIAGVGVFAIRPIPAGTNVFGNDQRKINWVPEDEIEALPEHSPEKSLYLEFGIRKDGRYGCPSTFNLLTVGWFLNEPRDGEEASLRVTEDFEMIARRDIAAGEELTVRYDTFSDSSP